MTVEAASIKRRASGMASTLAERLPDDARLLAKTLSDLTLQAGLIVEMGGTRYAIAIQVVGRTDELPPGRAQP